MAAFIRQGLALSAVWLMAIQAAFADEPARPLDHKKIAAAAERGLALVQKAAANYPKNRACFSCHHQTLPMLAIVSARRHGLAVDEDILEAQAEFTRDSFDGKIANLKAGKNIGGRGMTVAYALWALALAGEKPDETTEAMVAYLLKNQHKEGHWSGQVSRPPLEDSFVTSTVLAMQGMKRYATEMQRPEVKKVMARASDWLDGAALKSQEDKNARLWGLFTFAGKPEQLHAAREVVLKSQRSDGGWGQLDAMES